MGPFLILNAALVGFFGFAAIYHLILWYSSRRETLLAVFGTDCGVRAVFIGAMMALATVTTPAEAQSAQHARIAFGILIMVTWVWSLSLISGVQARWFVWPITVFFLILFPLHIFVLPLNATVISVETYTMPWGENISNPQLGPPPWWVVPIYFVVISIELFGLYCGFRLWVRDHMAGSLILLATCALMSLHVAHILRTFGVLDFPFIVIGHGIWACMIGLVIARRNHQMREQLAASEQRFRGIFDQTFQFIGLMRTDGTLIEANRTALEFAGSREENVIGKPFWEVPCLSLLPDLQNRLRQAVTDAAVGQMVRFEVTLSRLDGKLAYIDFSLKPVRNDRGEINLLIAEGRDISERKQAEDEHRKLEAQIRRTQKLESLGVLAGGIAHDFNNLLTVVLGNANLAMKEIPQKSPACRLLEEIEKGARRAADLTNQMLAYSGKGHFVIQPLRLDSLVEELIRLLKTIVSKKAHVVLDLEPTTIEGDATQVRQIVMNLITNASEALEGQPGELHVRTGIRNVEVADLRSPFVPEELPAGAYAFVEVEDSGCGMSEETLGKIFDPFFTTKFTGRGLGLAAVLGIVRGHRGTIKVSSTLGQGTVIEALFPCAAAAVAKVTDSGTKEQPRGQGTVLVVDDEPMIRSFARNVLETAGFSVRTAEDGTQGLEAFTRHSQEIVAVILDLSMPGRDGLEVLRELHSLVPNLPVLVMSGYSEQEVSIRCGGTGASGFILKPFTPNDLIARVCELLSSKASDNGQCVDSPAEKKRTDQ